VIPQRLIGFHPALARLKQAMPAVAFFAGFLWDAITLGRSVSPLDLIILSAYLAGSAGLLWWLGRRQALAVDQAALEQPIEAASWLRDSGPFFLLQFLLGGLFSALFIFYFKSSGYFLATLWALGLGALLVANEFMEDRYRRFTLAWAMFGLCAMLLLNFVLPYVVGGISAVWFVLSSLAGAGLAHWLFLKTPGQPGRIRPVWGIAAGLLLAYFLNLIPPVPLVKKDIAIGHALTRVPGIYVLRQEKTPWWLFWRQTSKVVHLTPGEPLYCVSAVFAPSGLDTRLYHRWSRYDANRGWIDAPRIGFNLAGGRQGGYRGYTFKQNLAPGDWKVTVESEDGRTVAVHRFELAPEPLAEDTVFLDKRL
jgi:hypothetical protein